LYNPKQEKEGVSSKKKRLKISPRMITNNYLEFGLDISGDAQVDCGDFLRACIKQICTQSVRSNDDSGVDYKLENEERNSQNGKERDSNQGTNGNGQIHSDNGMDIKHSFYISIEWKFECESCHRYMVSNMKEYVLKIDGSKEGSLADLLQKFLHYKVCSCGNKCEVEPNVKHHGKYLFIEIDRSVDSNQPILIDSPQYLQNKGCDSSSKELSLYSLRLEEYYQLFGHEYLLFGTVDYNLEIDEGGHYITNLFSRNPECIRIHETEIKWVRKKPDFDVDTVIVALKKTVF